LEFSSEKARICELRAVGGESRIVEKFEEGKRTIEGRQGSYAVWGSEVKVRISRATNAA
jgi:hypothetical protein